LVDADLRRPTVHKLFEMPREPGLSDILQGNCSIDQALRPTPHSFLQVIPSGYREEHPGGLFEKQRLSDTIEHLRKRFEIVIFDAPPVLPVADTTILAGEMDGILMVIMGGLTPREVVQRARDILDDSNARILGVVLNNASRVLPYYYEYSYYGEDE
jgi:capsular exopolysaccharide synthesis family protein